MLWYNIIIVFNTNKNLKIFYERHNNCCVRDIKMTCTLVKRVAFCLAVVMFALLVYTIFVGVRLSYCSFCIIDARSFMSQESADEVYLDMNEFRQEIADECEYAYILCHASSLMRSAIVLAEVAVIFVSFMLWTLINDIEREVARNRARARRSRG